MTYLQIGHFMDKENRGMFSLFFGHRPPGKTFATTAADPRLDFAMLYNH
jgi:hypothetical protein